MGLAINTFCPITQKTAYLYILPLNKKALGFGRSHILRDVQPRALLTCNLCYAIILYALPWNVNAKTRFFATNRTYYK